MDSIPILHDPPSIIKFNFLPNSSTTSRALTGLILFDIFALGIAKGKSIPFSIFLIVLSFGNRTAIVLSLAVAELETLEPILFFKIKVIGPGHNFLKIL